MLFFSRLNLTNLDCRDALSLKDIAAFCLFYFRKYLEKKVNMPVIQCILFVKLTCQEDMLFWL